MCKLAGAVFSVAVAVLGAVFGQKVARLCRRATDCRSQAKNRKRQKAVASSSPAGVPAGQTLFFWHKHSSFLPS